MFLDEAGKLFERVLSACIIWYFSEAGPDLTDVQIWFREGRSTVNAVYCGSVLLVVSQEAARLARSGVLFIGGRAHRGPELGFFS